MTVQALAWALDQNLPPKAKMVLVALCNHADHRDGRCYIEAETVAREASIKPASLSRYLGALERNKYLLRRKDRKAGSEFWIEFDRTGGEWEWLAAGEGDDDHDAAPAAPKPLAVAKPPAAFAKEVRPAPKPAAKTSVFVIEGSRAWDSWIEYRRARGEIPVLPTCWGEVDGRKRRGWYLPSLFAPGAVEPELQEAE